MHVTSVHPGTVDVTRATQPLLDKDTADEIADVVMRFGSQRFLLIPWLVPLLFVGVSVAIRLAIEPGADKELVKLLGLLIGPFVLMEGIAILSCVLIGYIRKVRAGLALRCIELEPGLRTRAYRAGLRRRRSIGVLRLRRHSLREQVLQQILAQAPKYPT